MQSHAPTTIPIRHSLAVGYRETARHFWHAARLVLAVQGVVALVAAPLLGGLFSLAARSAGLASVTTADLGRFLASPLGLAIAALSAVLTILVLTLQAGVFATVAWMRQSGISPNPRAVARSLLHRVARLARRADSLLLIPYLLLVVPLAHVGIGSALTSWAAIPSFVTDELLKEPLTAALYFAVILLLCYVNVRLIFTVPVLLLTDSTVVSAIVQSWRLTRWRTVKVLALIAGVMLPLALGVALVSGFAVLPVLVSDAVASAASLVVAAFALGAAQFMSFLLVGVFLLVHAHVLVAAASSAGTIPLAAGAPQGSAVESPRRSPRTVTILSTMGAAAAVGVLAVNAYAQFGSVSAGATTVLAHRGFTAGGVENTIAALEAASAAGADVVEMDVQQTADSGWVLMHDADLKRLAGENTSVAALTLAEATAVTVRDEQEHSGLIPSLEEYLRRADDLDQQLLIEIKVHGGESAGYVAELIELIDEVDGADEHIYHTLSADVVADFKALRPDLRIGFIVPLAFGGVPDDSPADFLVVEQGVYSQQLRDDVWRQGKSVFVWTVEEPEKMRELFRDSVDGIISDRPDLAADELHDVVEERGMASRMFDALGRLFTF